MQMTGHSGTVCVHMPLRTLQGPSVNPLFSSEAGVIFRAKGSLFVLWASPRNPAQASPRTLLSVGCLLWVSCSYSQALSVPPCGPCWALLVTAGDCLFSSAFQIPQPCLWSPSCHFPHWLHCCWWRWVSVEQASVLRNFPLR